MTRSSSGPILGLTIVASAILLLMAITVADAWGWIAGLSLGILGALLVLGRSRYGKLVYRRLDRWSRPTPRLRSTARPHSRSLPRPVARSITQTGMLDQLKALTPTQFEEFARLLLTAAGYRDVQRVGGSGDQGVDLRMRDAAGNLCVVQCKRYQGTVSPAVVRELYGVMARNGAREAYLLTTGRVSSDAQAWIGTKPLHIWPADRLVRYAEQYLGANLAATIRQAQRAA